MHRFFAGLSVLAAVALVAAPAHAASVPKGPAGLDFYNPPKSQPKGHGKPIHWRRLTGDPVLKSAASNRLLLYGSTSADGGAVAVSATVAVHTGKAPKGGAPVVRFALGTVGISDA